MFSRNISRIFLEIKSFNKSTNLLYSANRLTQIDKNVYFYGDSIKTPENTENFTATIIQEQDDKIQYEYFYISKGLNQVLINKSSDLKRDIIYVNSKKSPKVNGFIENSTPVL